MEPTDLLDEERALLPPHQVRKYGDNQPEYRPLPSVLFDGSNGRVLSRWTLTPEERKKVADGEDLYIEQLTFGNKPQPILPNIGLREFCPADEV